MAMVVTMEEHEGGCIGLGFDLWRRMTALGLSFEEHDVWAAI